MRNAPQAQTANLGHDTLGWTGQAYHDWLVTTLTRLINAAMPLRSESVADPARQSSRSMSTRDTRAVRFITFQIFREAVRLE